LGKQYSVGLFGYGCVGQGFFHTLSNSVHHNIQIDKICVKDVNKKREHHKNNFTFEKNDILKNVNQDFIVELTDNEADALDIVRTALLNGKNVVSANKKLIANNITELLDLQNKTGSTLLYDAACAGSIPVIRTLEDYYQNEKIRSVRGILNGTCNFILTSMYSGCASFEDALLNAQTIGFAESDPTLDISGEDSKFKNCIISAHSNGKLLKPETVLTLGITSVTKADIEFAKRSDSKIKLTTYIFENEKVFTSFVVPSFIDSGDNLYNVDQENNAVEIDGEFTSGQVYVGKGAGSYPTGLAVLSDIAALSTDYKYCYRKLKKKSAGHLEFADPFYEFDLKIYIGYDNPEDIVGLELHSIEKEDKVSDRKYIVCRCSVSSMKKLSKEQLSKIFVCAFDPLKSLNEYSDKFNDKY
jgi:homoserine dehydrogenase